MKRLVSLFSSVVRERRDRRFVESAMECVDKQDFCSLSAKGPPSRIRVRIVMACLESVHGAWHQLSGVLEPAFLRMLSASETARLMDVVLLHGPSSELLCVADAVANAENPSRGASDHWAYDLAALAAIRREETDLARACVKRLRGAEAQPLYLDALDSVLSSDRAQLSKILSTYSQSRINAPGALRTHVIEDLALLADDDPPTRWSASLRSLARGRPFYTMLSYSHALVRPEDRRPPVTSAYEISATASFFNAGQPSATVRAVVADKDESAALRVFGNFMDGLRLESDGARATQELTIHISAVSRRLCSEQPAGLLYLSDKVVIERSPKMPVTKWCIDMTHLSAVSRVPHPVGASARRGRKKLAELHSYRRSLLA